MKITEPKILSQSIGDAEVQYLLYEGKGSVIVFLHATGFLPWLWHPIARELSETHTIIAPYFCDHRDADPDEGGLNWFVLADDLYKFCQNLKIESPFFVGHSMGATVMTIANAAHESFARKMILIEPIFLPEELYKIKINLNDHPLASKSINRRNFWENEVDAKNYLRSRGLFKNWDDEMFDIYIKYGMIEGETGGLQLACHPRKEASLFMGGMHFNPWPMLSKVNCPVLVIEGEESENRIFIDLKKAVSMFPDGAYKLIKNTGHLIPMEKPAEIISIITNFFKD